MVTQGSNAQSDSGEREDRWRAIRREQWILGGVFLVAFFTMRDLGFCPRALRLAAIPAEMSVARTESRWRRGVSSTVVDAVLPFAQASVAYTGEVKERRGRGKLVIAVVAQEASGGKV